jgi:hypothetical protein
MEGAVDPTVAVVVADSMAVEVVADSTVVGAAVVVASMEVAATFMVEAVDFLEVVAEVSAEEVAGTFAEVVVFVAGLPVLQG